MSYQSVKTRSTTARCPARWMLLTASLLSVAALFALRAVSRPPPVPTETPGQSAQEPVAPEATAPAKTEEPAAAEIDPGSLADSTPLPPPAIRPRAQDATQEQPVPPIVFPPGSLASPKAIEETLEGLTINAVTNDKTIINGHLFSAGDFIDEGRRVKFIRRADGKLFFEVNGKIHACKRPY